MRDKTKPVAIDPLAVPAQTGTSYPAPFDADCTRREKRRLGDAFGLTHFGVNMVHLAPGQMSSQRHWHTREDEFTMMLEGEAVLVTDAGEQTVTPGMVMGFAAGAENGHHLVNRSDRVAVYLEVSTCWCASSTAGIASSTRTAHPTMNDVGSYAPPTEY
jgi:uncharacterized cupin superfamily protein